MNQTMDRVVQSSLPQCPQHRVIYPFDVYDSSSNDEEYLLPTNGAETTPGRRDHTARLLTAARLYLNSPPAQPMNWGQIIPNLNDYHSDPMWISSTFWIPDITDWWRQHDERHSKYTDLSNVARDIFTIIPHGVRVESSFSLGRVVVGWRQSKTTGHTFREKFVAKQIARPNIMILAGDETDSYTTNTENDSERKKQSEERTLHSIAKVNDILDMWQGSQDLRATQEGSRAENKQMTAVGYISDTEEIVKASWTHFQHNREAAFRLTERSPLPPVLAAKEVLGGQTQILNVRRIRTINRHPVQSDEDSATESIFDTEDWLNRNGDLDNPNHTVENLPGTHWIWYRAR